MSNKKEVRELERRLEAVEALCSEAVTQAQGVIDDLRDMSERDFDMAIERRGAIANRYEAQAEFLDDVAAELDNNVDDINTASGSIMYALQDWAERSKP